MKIFKNILYLFAIVLFFGACDETDPITLSAEDASVAFDVYNPELDFNSSSVRENSTSPLRIPITYSGLPGGGDITISLEVDNSTASNPAQQGVDFTLSSTSITFSGGYGTQFVEVIPVDNGVYEGNKTFVLSIVAPEGMKTNTNNSIVVSLIDDEHPLAKWIGTYSVDAKSYGDPGNWDEAWTVNTAPDPEDDTKLLMTGIGAATGTKVIATLDVDNMTVTVATYQTIEGDIYGYGDVLVKYGMSNLTTTEEAFLTGTISEDGSIHIDNWAHELTGANAGYVWDVFDTYWTKQ